MGDETLVVDKRLIGLLSLPRFLRNPPVELDRVEHLGALLGERLGRSKGPLVGGPPAERCVVRGGRVAVLLLVFQELLKHAFPPLFFLLASLEHPRPLGWVVGFGPRGKRVRSLAFRLSRGQRRSKSF